MKILVIGSGGREHAICWKLSQDKKITKIYCAPGNGGTAMTEKCENVDIVDVKDIVSFASRKKIDITIVGSEELLVEGIVDKFQKKGLKIFGPDKKAAMLEGSKAYAKEFMKKYGIKTATYDVFDDAIKAKDHLRTATYPLVIKASGLAAGKGVLICDDVDSALTAVDEIMIDKLFKDAGEKIVIEEYLEGVEASILSFTDSKVILPFISAKDHKKIKEGEKGLNTGGMGTIAPNPYVTEDVYKKFITYIMKPTLKGIKAEKMDFCGVIFFGLMITVKGVYLLEYNMRMGDPETQVVLPLLGSNLLELIEKSMTKELKGTEIQWKKGSACCVVLASGGYPEKYEKGYEISGYDNIDNLMFVAGAKEEKGKLYTNGGRVLNMVALGDTLEEARKKAYKDVDKIKFKNKYFRQDIGKIEKK